MASLSSVNIGEASPPDTTTGGFPGILSLLWSYLDRPKKRREQHGTQGKNYKFQLNKFADGFVWKNRLRDCKCSCLLKIINNY